MGNNSRVEAKGIGTCKLQLHGGQMLYLHDVLYAPEIRRNLVSVTVLLNMGTSSLLNGFMILNVINYNYNQDSLITSSDSMNVNV